MIFPNLRIVAALLRLVFLWLPGLETRQFIKHMGLTAFMEHKRL